MRLGMLIVNDHWGVVSVGAYERLTRINMDKGRQMIDWLIVYASMFYNYDG